MSRTWYTTALLVSPYRRHLFLTLGSVARPSCGRMIRLLAHPLLPPLPSCCRLSLFLTLPVCRRSSLPTGEGGRVWARNQIVRPRESMALHKSFNTLFCWLLRREKLVHKWKVSFIITHKICKTDPLNFAHYYIYYIQSIKGYGVLLIFFLRAQFYGRSCLPCMEGKGLGRDQVDHFRYCMYTVYLRFIFSLVQVITYTSGYI